MPSRLRSRKLVALASVLGLWGVLLLVALLPGRGVAAYLNDSTAFSAAGPQAAPLTWLPSRTDGFNHAASSAQTLLEYKGRLYAGSVAGATGSALIWAHDQGSGWTPSSAPGFGGPNLGVYALAAYHDVLYAGTANPNGGQVWSSGGEGWSHAADNGFDNRANIAVAALAAFKGRLYAGTHNVGGAQIWEYDGQRWSQVAAGGLGDPDNLVVESFAVYGDKLYCGTRNAGGGQIWSTVDGRNWSVVIGDGFGRSSNVAITALIPHNRELYATVENSQDLGTEIWRFDWIAWRRSVSSGFASPDRPFDIHNSAVTSLATHDGVLYAGTSNRVGGAQIWFNDGTGWWTSAREGLGTGASGHTAHSLASHGGSLWVGIESEPHGAAVWRGDHMLGFTVISEPEMVTPTYRIRYDTRIQNTMGVVLTGLQAVNTWEDRDNCVYDVYARQELTWDIGTLSPGESSSHKFTLETHSWCQPQIVTATVRLQGQNLAPMYDFATTVISAAAKHTPTPSPTVGPVGPFTTILQQGLGGYAGTEDSHLYRIHPDRPYCDKSLTYVGNQQRYAGLIRFDLTPIPHQASVVSATLRLYAAGWLQGEHLPIGAHVISRTVQFCEATWQRSRAGEPWAASGCNDSLEDRRPEPEDFFTTSGVRRWYDLDITSAVSGWLAGSLPNNGLLLRSLAKWDSEAIIFASAEYSEPTVRPMLIVTYLTEPLPTTTPTPTGTRQATPSVTTTLTPTQESTLTPTGTIPPPCPDLYEPNDSFASAWHIGWGDHVESFICSADDVDYFEADIGSQPFSGFRVTLSNLPQNYDLQVYDMSQRLIASSTKPGLEAETATVALERIYVRVTGASGAHDRSQEYHLDVIPVSVPTATATFTPTITPTPTETPLVWQVYLPVATRRDVGR